jgi:hypothetical protein
MRFVAFPRRNNYFLRSTLSVLAFTCLATAAALAASPAAHPSFIYCLNQGGAKVFAGRQEANGNLTFGISVWSPAGHNISVFGVATRRGRQWEYTEDLQAATAAERCQLNIVHGSDGTLRVAADPNATCQSHGGVNAEIGVVQFPRTAYEGAVTTELDDPEAFQRAGKCIGNRN